MVVKSRLKFIHGLQQKKYRTQYGLFVVEGLKLVSELLNSDFKVENIYALNTADFPAHEKLELVSKAELSRMSGLKNSNTVLGVFHIPKTPKIVFDNWIVALDDVRDPGNLGTIIRLCDWFGIPQIVCSLNTVDCFNPKVLQASMGSMARVRVAYLNLEEMIAECGLPVYGTFMEGTPVYRQDLPEKGVLIMGNEGNGISEKLETLSDYRISIPQFGKKTTESLNVATATGILLNEIRRA